jgi:hypothetical protein
MPDHYGFNHLGDNVRCIDCATGGPIGHWPEHKRAKHACSHGTGPRQSGADPPRRTADQQQRGEGGHHDGKQGNR